MCFVTTLVNTYGGSWFDMQWNPKIDSPEWKKAITFYVDLLKNTALRRDANGFNENLTLFAAAKRPCGSTRPSPPFALHKKESKCRQSRLRQCAIGRHAEGLALALVVGVRDSESREISHAAQKFALWATRGIHQIGGGRHGLGHGAARHT